MSKLVPPLDRRTYLSERTFAQEVRRDQTKFVAQSLLTLSGGSLAISLTFLEKFVSPNGAVQPLLLGLAWGALGGSIITVLASTHTSQWAIGRHLDNLDDNHRSLVSTSFENPWATVTAGLNYLATALLIAGVSFLAIFAFVNTPRQLSKDGVTSMPVQTPTYTPPRTPGGGWTPSLPPVVKPTTPAPVTPPPAAPPAEPVKKAIP